MAVYAHLPTPYRTAIEAIDACGPRTEARLRALCAHWGAANGYPADAMHESWVSDAVAISTKRFHDFEPTPDVQEVEAA